MSNRYTAFDRYGLRHLPKHLANREAGGQILPKLLSDFDWLQHKLEIVGPSALIEDYDLLTDGHDLKLVQKALRLADHILANNEEQLAGQLLGRLLVYRSRDIQELLQQVRNDQKGPWLRPVRASLMLPTEPLLRTLTGHTDSVRALAVTPDERYLISGCRDTTIRVWSIEDWTVLRTLHGHEGWVMALAVTPDGRKLVSASWDRTLRVWDLSDGTCIFTLRGHTDPVFDVAITPAGQYAISASRDKTLKMWDLESGTEVRTLRGHTNWAKAVVVTPDGGRIISGSSDRIIKAWDAETGIELFALEWAQEGSERFNYDARRRASYFCFVRQYAQGLGPDE